jgi:hypothetical protein
MRITEIDSMQSLIQPHGSPDGQGLRLQITDAPQVFSIVTTPTPASLPLSCNSTALALPLCGSEVDFEKTDEMSWKATNAFNLFNFADSAGGVKLCQRASMSAVVWVNGTLREVGGGIGVVEVHHRL